MNCPLLPRTLIGGKDESKEEDIGRQLVACSNQNQVKKRHNVRCIPDFVRMGRHLDKVELSIAVPLNVVVKFTLTSESLQFT